MKVLLIKNSTRQTIKPLWNSLPYMQILNSVSSADKWMRLVYIIERLRETAGELSEKGSTKLSSAWLLSRPKCQAWIHHRRRRRRRRREKEDGLDLSRSNLKWEREREKTTTWDWVLAGLRSQLADFFKRHTLFSLGSFQKGASLARNKEALIAKANTIRAKADSRDGNEAVIMSLSLTLSFALPSLSFLSLRISIFPSLHLCLINSNSLVSSLSSLHLVFFLHWQLCCCFLPISSFLITFFLFFS